MASLVRPALLRSAQRTAPGKRLIHAKKPSIIPTSIRSQSLQSNTTSTTLKATASFHTTSRRDILPPLPQRLSGTANEAAPVPTPSPSHGNYHWDFERAVSVALVPVTIAPFAAGSLHPVTDAVLCGLLIIHSHVGFTSCIIDYFPSKRVPRTRTALEWILRLSTLGVAVGLYEFETNDVGVTEAITRIWKAR
ncbi:MAG: hypothetical protein M1828_006695 [Chrysothrix sp. TS-e1954]|nr:MAG: hypothetical protein M1828_006695 [Chrysothrix sp. TS-e1954]